jgi:hypothetical protein
MALRSKKTGKIVKVGTYNPDLSIVHLAIYKDDSKIGSIFSEQRAFTTFHSDEIEKELSANPNPRKSILDNFKTAIYKALKNDDAFKDYEDC